MLRSAGVGASALHVRKVLAEKDGVSHMSLFLITFHFFLWATCRLPSCCCWG